MAEILKFGLDPTDPDFFPMAKLQHATAATVLSGTLKVQENALRRVEAKGVVELLELVRREAGLTLDSTVE